MARRYSRDNRGRFASGGSSSGGGGKVGATARGGRLRTAAGNKRATQTTKAAAAKPSGTVAGKVKRNPAAAGKIGKQAKPQSQVSSARQAATDRLKIKTATRRKLSADRESVIPSTPKGPKTMRAQRVGSTVPKSIARTKGNEPAKVAKRVNRKVFSADKQLARNLQLRSKGQLVNSKSDVRLLKRSITLKKAQNYLRTGKVVRDNSMAFKRQIKESTAQINAKRAARTAAKPKTQKERWASRSAILSSAAAKNEAKAKRMFDATSKTDTAFNTQPGRLPGRARMNAQTERSFKLQEKAAQQRSRAANLERMANTNKGDAAKRRATRADVIKTSHKGLKKGDTVEGTLYGAREVVKVNAKSVTVKGAVKNFTIPWEQIKPKQ
jgi:hypothetical protein